MEGSQLLEVLKTLDEAERKALLLYAEAMISFGKKIQEDALSLLQIIMTSAPRFEAEKLQKEHIYAQIFPDTPWVSGKLEKVMVEANKLVRMFLLQKFYLKNLNAVQQQLDWAKVMAERGLVQQKQVFLQKLQHHPLVTHAPVSQEEAYEQFLIEMAVVHTETEHNNMKGDLNIPKALKAFDIYSHLVRLELLNNYLLQQKVINLTIPQSVELAIESVAISTEYSAQTPILQVFEKIFRLLQKDIPQIEDFTQMAELLAQNENHIAPDLLKQSFTYLRNLCTILINAGATQLLPAYHQLQRDNLERGYLYYEGNKLSASAYISVALGAIRAHNFEWAATFIEDHKGRVIGDNKTFDLYHLNKAQYLFAIGQYEAALDIIPPTFEYLNYTLIAKRLEIKALYELRSDLFQYKLGAFKVYITRASQKHLSSALRGPNSEFVNILLQIQNSKPGDPMRSRRIQQRIQQKTQAAERDWLWEKAANLK
jgi:hypothetical protein